jgi:3-oxoadipate enol-lactonase
MQTLVDSPAATRRSFIAGAGALSMAGLAACASAPARKRGNIALDGGGQLYYEEAGSGAPVVLVHGFTLDTRMWDDQFDALARNYRVIRYDLRGFGKSSLPTAPYVHADDAKRLLDQLGIAKAHWVGLSAGGRVALDVAVRHPAIVDKLVVIDSFVGGYVPTQAYRDSFGAMIAAARGGDMAKAKGLWLDHDLFKPAASQPAVAARLRQMVQDYSGFHWAQTNPETPLNPPALRQLKEIKSPVLVVVGEKDIEDVQVQTNLLWKEIGDARKRVVPGVGHMSNMEAPQAVNALIREFLG